MIDKPNIFLDNTGETFAFTSPKSARPKALPCRNRYEHGEKIRREFQACFQHSSKSQQAIAIRKNEGTYIEIRGLENYTLTSKSLENLQQGIRLCNIRNDGNVEIATVFIPQGKEVVFLKKIDSYLTEDTDAGKPKNQNLIDSIESVKRAVIESFWFGLKDDLPIENEKWCEVWFRCNERNEDIGSQVEGIFYTLNALEIKYKNDYLHFPERIVLLLEINQHKFEHLLYYCENILEFRLTPEPNNFFESLTGVEQKAWVSDLLSRIESNNTTVPNDNLNICILDTGISIHNPLLIPFIQEKSLYTVNHEWAVDDVVGHGSEMAGVALFGNLKKCLVGNRTINIQHSLESVKILPDRGSNSSDLYGAITEQAVLLPKIDEPNTNRIYCMAVTADKYGNYDGSPTSWSAAIDSITSGVIDNEKKLFFISAGNVKTTELSSIQYPESSINHSVESPGESWNAITVGAFANDIFDHEDYNTPIEIVADVNELSPYSSTSLSWDKRWPIKPEILLDGGNMISTGDDYSNSVDLSLLTTSHRPLNHLFSYIWGTSAATAKAAWMGAKILEEYPNMWPETVRALLIHSADWTDKMKAQFLGNERSKTALRRLLRCCGYGIPTLEKALQCYSNSINMIIESEIKPYCKKNSSYSINEMHLHKIPWPNQVLESLGETKARLKVTLSYFIEPGPGEVGWKDKYRYPSCGLRFDVINSNETLEDFEKRINKKMRSEELDDRGDGSPRDWFLGVHNRDVGSIHSDFCESMAIELKDTEYIAVYPITGWWKERGYLKKFDERLRYSLIVTIETPGTEADLYTEILTKITSTSIVTTV